MLAFAFITAAPAVAASASSTHASSASSRPNILFILADDYGIGEVSCYGADNYRTPNIDRLASEGTRFSHAYTPSLCGPSRATILTGRYLFRTGATNQDATGRFTPAMEIMMPRILKQAGYATAAIGKWGQLPLRPNDFGFDEYLRFNGSGVYWNSQDKGKRYELNGKDVPLKDGQYMPDVMHDTLVEFMTRHREKPFYVYYSLSHVHGEILRTPDSAPDSQDHYGDNVRYMDKLVGKVLSELDRLKLREKTLVVFFGDNGTAKGKADRATIGGRRLAGEKGSMLEGGSREPLIVRWPGVTPAGRVLPDLIDSTDFVPTFAELAGAPLPSDRVIDGKSFAAQILGKPGQPREWVFLQLAAQWYTLEKGWKLNQNGELFDLSRAPFEEIPVPADTANPAALAARQRLQKALDGLNPAGGFKDDGDGTGRHANKEKKRKRKAEN